MGSLLRRGAKSKSTQKIFCSKKPLQLFRTKRPTAYMSERSDSWKINAARSRKFNKFKEATRSQVRRQSVSVWPWLLLLLRGLQNKKQTAPDCEPSALVGRQGQRRAGDVWRGAADGRNKSLYLIARRPYHISLVPKSPLYVKQPKSVAARIYIAGSAAPRTFAFVVAALPQNYYIHRPHCCDTLFVWSRSGIFWKPTPFDVET